MIPFIDLKTQYRRIENRVDGAIKQVLEHGQYILGPEVAELEKQLAGYENLKERASRADALQREIVEERVFVVNPAQFFEVA